jgi:hypothetical protein
VIKRGFSGNNAQILQVQLQHKNRYKKGQTKVEGECRMAITYSEENAQYLNHLLDKDTWELVLKKKSAHEAYNEFLDTFQYYYKIAMPKNG